MAVYTQVSDAALGDFLSAYDIGEPRSFKGIAEGVENSNYYLETSTDKFILTLFEKRVNQKDLPYFIALKRHLAASGFPCPEPIAGKDGECLRTLEGRPALIISFLTGLSVETPNITQCRELGVAMARMHAALSDFQMTRANDLGPADWPDLWDGRADTANSLRAGLAADIDADLAAIAAARPTDFSLPRGTIHADLFPDNVFFSGDTFAGVIDFYFSCTDALIYDVAICLNAWAFNEMGQYDLEKGCRAAQRISIGSHAGTGGTGCAADSRARRCHPLFPHTPCRLDRYTCRRLGEAQRPARICAQTRLASQSWHDGI